MLKMQNRDLRFLTKLLPTLEKKVATAFGVKQLDVVAMWNGKEIRILINK